MANTMVFGAHTVVFGANTVVFGENTVVFVANTVVFGDLVSLGWSGIPRKCGRSKLPMI